MSTDSGPAPTDIEPIADRSLPTAESSGPAASVTIDDTAKTGLLGPTPIPVSVSAATADVQGYTLVVSVTSEAGRLTGIEIDHPAHLIDVSVADDGRSATVRVAGATRRSTTTDQTRQFDLLVDARAAGAPVKITIEQAIVRQADGTTTAVGDRRNYTGMVATPPLVDGGGPITNLDDDGTYEDIDGDDDLDSDDVNALFVLSDTPAVSENVPTFDFDSDGRITLQDVMALHQAALSSSSATSTTTRR
ncbi:MAG: hypothetical protein ABEJ86_08020 [Halococcoides sp.]